METLLRHSVSKKCGWGIKKGTECMPAKNLGKGDFFYLLIYCFVFPSQFLQLTFKSNDIGEGSDHLQLSILKYKIFPRKRCKLYC